jgi:DNA-binding SARP family transcriptional activator
VECDALQFRAAIDDGRLREALDRYQGELLPGFFVSGVGAFEDWLETEREHFREQAVTAAWRLVEIFVADRELTNASQLARVVARLSPSDERMLRRVITMLARLEDRAGAMDVYSRFAQRLWKEFETRPSAVTQQLVAAIQRGDPL